MIISVNVCAHRRKTRLGDKTKQNTSQKPLWSFYVIVLSPSYILSCVCDLVFCSMCVCVSVQPQNEEAMEGQGVRTVVGLMGPSPWVKMMKTATVLRKNWSTFREYKPEKYSSFFSSYQVFIPHFGLVDYETTRQF